MEAKKALEQKRAAIAAQDREVEFVILNMYKNLCIIQIKKRTNDLKEVEKALHENELKLLEAEHQSTKAAKELRAAAALVDVVECEVQYT